MQRIEKKSVLSIAVEWLILLIFHVKIIIIVNDYVIDCNNTGS